MRLRNPSSRAEKTCVFLQMGSESNVARIFDESLSLSGLSFLFYKVMISSVDPSAGLLAGMGIPDVQMH